MKLLEAINKVKETEKVTILKITDCIRDRLLWMDIRDMCNSEKYEQLEYIYDLLELLNETNEDESRTELLNEIKEFINDYQCEYGGLSKLEIK